MTIQIKTQLEKVCRPNKIVDQFQYIYFRNGYIYVSSGNVHLKQRMELHGISLKAQELLNGFCIHKDVLKHLRSSKSEWSIHKGRADLTRILKYTIANNPCQACIQDQALVPGKGRIVNQIDSAIEKFKLTETEKITIIPESIELIRKSFVNKSTGFTFYMNGTKERLLITPNENDYNEMALVMTLSISGEFKKI